MKQWTEAAEMRWESYLRERVAREGLAGDEADDLRDDLRRHIHEELKQLDSATCGLNEIEHAIARMDRGYEMPKVPLTPEITGIKARMYGVSFWFFGVIFPSIVVIFEWLSNFCGSHFFDPIPTWGHGLVLLSVPLLNAWLIRSRRHADAGTWRKRAIASGLGFGVGLFYALLYLPLLPMSCIALLAFGMGLLSLCPIITWALTWRLASAEKRLARMHGCKRFGRAWWATAAVAFAALISFEVPALWTRYQAARSMSEDEEISQPALRTLRNWHSRRALLNMCYESSNTMEGGDMSSWISHRGWKAFSLGSRWIPQDEVNKKRDLYFRVTGEPFNASPRPDWTASGPFAISRGALMMDEEMDNDHGGDVVAARIRHLDCKESRFDAHLDGKARTGYGEWTLVFQNRSATAREARCQIRLPRHGQVSRLTLWIHGEPQEAAFGTVAQVKAAYRAVAVVQRRDPVLVNMVGPDTIMVQCFPVPANGEMKIRIGITAPFDQGTWSLPRIIEKNFGETSSFEHALWLQSDLPFLMTDGEKRSHPDDKMHSLNFGSKSMNLQAEIPDAKQEAGTVWCEDPFATAGEKILIGRPQSSKLAPVESLIVVVDGSRSMAKHRDQLANALRGRVDHIYLAQDDSTEVSADDLARKTFMGGCDNEPALYQALLKAKESPHSAVVWLHGPQPISMSQSERIRQVLERGSNPPRFYAVPVAEGSNRLFESLGRSGLMSAAPDLGTAAGKLAAWLEVLRQGEPHTSWEWTRRADPTGVEGTKVTDQLARLWAMEEVAKTKDSALAVRYQLVSYVSGAVVLETKEQYDAHGLKQVDATSTPTITNVPEPSTGLLIMISTMVMCLRRRR